MNLNQAAHGDREHAYIQTRLGHAPHHGRRPRLRPGGPRRGSPPGCGPPPGWAATHDLRLVRFGDNMRGVAVTEGDKTEAEIPFGVSVNTYAVNDLVDVVEAVADAEVDRLVGGVRVGVRRGCRAAPRRRAPRVAALRGPAGAGAAHHARRASAPRRSPPTSRTSGGFVSCRAWPYND